MNADRNRLHACEVLALVGATFCLFVASGCGDGGNGGGTGTPTLTGCADTATCSANPPLQIGSSRPANVRLPADYTTAVRYPLVIVLHGFGASGALQALYFGLNERVDSQQFVLVVPDGTRNAGGMRFWNATPACCAFLPADRDVDDVTYLRSLIEEAAATYSIDARRVGLIGHSNGGFMALRMVCEASDLVTSVVSLAGSTFADAASCTPATNPVSVLTLHGDADGTIRYEGAQILGESYPGAIETIDRFAALAGCDTDNPTMPPNIDVLGGDDGAETTVLSYADCADGADVELWTLLGAPHIPFPYNAEALDAVVDWLILHQR